MAVRERDVLRLGASCGDLIVRGLNYQRYLADGALRVLQADAGVGFAVWCLSDPGASYCEPVQLFAAGAPNPTPAQVAGLLAAMPDHPLGRGRIRSDLRQARRAVRPRMDAESSGGHLRGLRPSRTVHRLAPRVGSRRVLCG